MKYYRHHGQVYIDTFLFAANVCEQKSGATTKTVASASARVVSLRATTVPPPIITHFLSLRQKKCRITIITTIKHFVSTYKLVIIFY